MLAQSGRVAEAERVGGEILDVVLAQIAPIRRRGEVAVAARTVDVLIGREHPMRLISVQEPFPRTEREEAQRH